MLCYLQLHIFSVCKSYILQIRKPLPKYGKLTKNKVEPSHACDHCFTNIFRTCNGNLLESFPFVTLNFTQNILHETEKNI